MRVCLTGGAGLIGRAAAEYLLERGHSVHMIDVAAETDAPHTTYASIDVTDYAALFAQIRGCEAVVHLAAIRNATRDPGHEVYRVNMTGTFNVFEAAAQHGIKRVVQASSINALGCAWAVGDWTPRYLPVDEDHPLTPTDPYSFSKQQIEEVGDYYWRRERISSVALRLPGIYSPEKRRDSQAVQGRARMRAFLDGFVALPMAERERQIEAVRAAALAYRAGRGLEYPHGRWKIDPIDGIDDRLTHAYMFDRFNLWASMDVRDAAIAIEQALTAEYDGSHAVFVNDTHNSLDYDTHTLVRLFLPEVSDFRRPLVGSEALISTERARGLIGFQPHYSVHEGAHHVEDR